MYCRGAALLYVDNEGRIVNKNLPFRLCLDMMTGHLCYCLVGKDSNNNFPFNTCASTVVFLPFMYVYNIKSMFMYIHLWI